MATGPDKRTEARAHVFLTATIYDASGSEPVRIRNLSGRGALLDGPTLPAVGSAVRLARGCLVAEGRTAWRGTGLAGINFTKPINPEAWITAVDRAGQQRVDEMVAILRRNEPVPQYLESVAAPSLPLISAALDELCGRLAALPMTSLEMGEELVKLDTIAQSLRRLATGHPY